MLRDTGHIKQPNLCWKNCIKETYGKVESEGENGSRDLNPPIIAAQACRWFPQFLRGLYEYLHHTGALQKKSKYIAVCTWHYILSS